MKAIARGSFPKDLGKLMNFDEDKALNSNGFKKWIYHKENSEIVSDYYRKSQYSQYSFRINECGKRLTFTIKEENLSLSDAWFCRVRHCPVCQWRRSLKWKSRAYKALPTLTNDFPKARWIFLTLTVKNCPLEDLRSTIKIMHDGFKHMTRLKSWPAKGWIKSTEITRDDNGFAHPHFHCLLMVTPSYFSGRQYLSIPRWSQMWMQSLQCNYMPIVNASAIPSAENPITLIPEILKYQTKPDDLIFSRDWLLGLTEQLYRSRAISTGGVLQKYFLDFGREPSSLKDDEDYTLSPEESFPQINVAWSNARKHYFLIT